MTTAAQRLTPDEIADLVEDLKDRADYGTADHYPVVIEATSYYLVWVEADSSDKAIDQVRNDGSWYERLSGEIPMGGDMDARSPETWEADQTSKIGPLNRCTECDGNQYYAGSSGMHHQPDCTKRPS